ncbi:Biopolymer transport protein ExbD/TolR [Thalassoporum mexicanum PCC 7367]|uniref:ExbD/TolR family protein n=1 Tax=Thalassoporum mexicanum TaxID=3457544 RepID=UPI00029FF7A3|nr:biopolymer transporter ExbD [Pseudanabaena sp. PCC 7367]AFY71657.1 Biopolymer transport protein ExbD/TolR [Pseudanabaena sp. PCC 7367]
MKIRSAYGSSSTENSSPTEINIIPLLDVVFSILAFFLLISTGLVAPQRIGVELPQTDNNGEQTNAPTRPMLVVTLDARGQTLIDGSIISDIYLKAEIEAYIQANPTALVVLNAEDESVSYAEVINKLDELRQIAGDRVAIATSTQP